MIINNSLDLLVNENWKYIQLENVYIECDTTNNPITINLFPIVQLNYFWNVKINIVDVTNNCSENNITINTGAAGSPPVYDAIDQEGNNQIVLNKNGESVNLTVVSINQWQANNSITIPSAVQSVTGLDTDNTDPDNPIVKIAVDDETIVGNGTPENPLASQISVGKSKIANGVTSGILFQDIQDENEIVNENENFVWNNDSESLGVGGSPDENVRLDVYAKTNTEAEKVLRLRNSDDSESILEVNGLNQIKKGNGTIIVPNVQSNQTSLTLQPKIGDDLIVSNEQDTQLTILNPTGSWLDGEDFLIRVKGAGVSQSIFYENKYRGIGVILPEFTTPNKLIYLGVVYNSVDNKYDITGVCIED